MSPKSLLGELRNRLSTFRVRGIDAWELKLTEQDIYQDLARHVNHRLLGRFSESDVRAALDTYGVWSVLKDKGFPNPRLVIKSIDPFRQSLRIYTDAGAPETEDHILCELRVFDAHLDGTCPLRHEPFETDALVIDWLTFQNPRGSFSPDRPQLPGQKYPGLGIMKTCMRAIIDLAVQTGKEAVINIPEYYHNAVLYQPAFRFFSAFVEGRLLALQKTLSHLSLAAASHAVASGKVLNAATEEPFVWKPHEQVYGLAPRIREYFDSDLYRAKVEEAAAASSFRLI